MEMEVMAIYLEVAEDLVEAIITELVVMEAHMEVEEEDMEKNLDMNLKVMEENMEEMVVPVRKLQIMEPIRLDGIMSILILTEIIYLVVE